MTSRSPSLAALIEIGMLFLPAIPAYLWAWPNLHGVALDVFQSLAYLYVLAGTLFIGLRRWNWQQLGVNRQGLWLSLACGLVVLIARLIIILGVDWGAKPPAFTWLGLAWNLCFYFCLVGLVEELLFRGLVYRLLLDWRGADRRGSVALAIFGSSLGFMLWHIFGQGVLAGLATFFIGLFFALLRHRAGGSLGLIVFHALWDLESVYLVASSNAALLAPGSFTILHPWLLRLGGILLFAVPLYLGFLHPRVERWLHRRG